MATSDEQRATFDMSEFRKLAGRLRNAAYRHGQIDAEDRWSNKKYRDVADASNAALKALLDAIAAQQAPQVRAEERYRQGYRDAADECASACRYQGRETANIDVEDSSVFVYTRATEACASACERLSNKAAANPQQIAPETKEQK